MEHILKEAIDRNFMQLQEICQGVSEARRAVETRFAAALSRLGDGQDFDFFGDAEPASWYSAAAFYPPENHVAFDQRVSVNRAKPNAAGLANRQQTGIIGIEADQFQKSFQSLLYGRGKERQFIPISVVKGNWDGRFSRHRPIFPAPLPAPRSA